MKSPSLHNNYNIFNNIVIVISLYFVSASISATLYADPSLPPWDLKTDSTLPLYVQEWLFEDTYWPVIHFTNGFIVQYFVGNWYGSLLLLYLYETIEAIIYNASGDLLGADPESLGGSLISDILIGFSGVLIFNLLSSVMFNYKYHRVPYRFEPFEKHWFAIVCYLLVFFGGTLFYWLPEESYFGDGGRYSWGFIVWNIYVPFVFIFIAYLNRKMPMWTSVHDPVVFALTPKVAAIEETQHHHSQHLTFRKKLMGKIHTIQNRTIQKFIGNREYWIPHLCYALFLGVYIAIMEFRYTHVFIMVVFMNTFLIILLILIYFIKQERRTISDKRMF